MRHYPASNLTPGHPNGLQQVKPKGAADWTFIINDEIAYVMDGEVLRIYRFDTSSTDAESLPEIVIPDGNGTGQGRWKQKKFKQVKESEVFPLREMINNMSIRKMENWSGLSNIAHTSLESYISDAVWETGTIEQLTSTHLFNGNTMQVYFDAADEDVKVTIIDDAGVTVVNKTLVMAMNNTGFSWVQCDTLMNGNVAIAARESTGDIFYCIVDYEGDIIVPKTEVWDASSAFGRGGVVALNDGGFVILWGDSGNSQGRFSRFEKDGTIIAQQLIWGDAFGGSEYPFSCEAVQLYNGNIFVAGNDGFTDGYAMVIDTDGNEVVPYLNLSDFVVGEVALGANGNVFLAGAWKAVGTGYPAYSILDPKLNTVKATTFINTTPNGSTQFTRVMALPTSGEWVYAFANGLSSAGQYDVIDKDGTRISTSSRTFVSGSVNGLTISLTSTGNIFFSWIDGVSDGHRRLFESKGVRFTKDFMIEIDGQRALFAENDRMRLGPDGGFSILVDWDDSEIIEMHDGNDIRKFRLDEDTIRLGQYTTDSPVLEVDTDDQEITLGRVSVANQFKMGFDVGGGNHYLKHTFFGQSLSQNLTLWHVDGVNERVDWGDPTVGLYMRYDFESDPNFRILSGATDMWFYISESTQRLGNSANAYIQARSNGAIEGYVGLAGLGTVLDIDPLNGVYQWGQNNLNMTFQTLGGGRMWLENYSIKYIEYNNADRDEEELSINAKLNVGQITDVHQADQLRARHELAGDASLKIWDITSQPNAHIIRTGIVVFRDAMYVVCGKTWNTSTSNREVWRSYDGINWELITSSAFNAPSVGPGYSHVKVVVWQDRMVALGGTDDGGNPMLQVYESVDGITWTVIDTKSFSRFASAHVFKGRIVVVGGTTNPSKIEWSTDGGRTWAASGGGLPGGSPRFRMASCVYKDALWLFGGHNNSSDQDDIYMSTDGMSFSIVGQLPSDTDGANAIVHNGKLKILGAGPGNAQGYSDVIWESTDGINFTDAGERLDEEVFWHVYNGVTIFRGRMIYGWVQKTNGSTYDGLIHNAVPRIYEEGALELNKIYFDPQEDDFDIWKRNFGGTFTRLVEFDDEIMDFGIVGGVRMRIDHSDSQYFRFYDRNNVKQMQISDDGMELRYGWEVQEITNSEDLTSGASIPEENMLATVEAMKAYFGDIANGEVSKYKVATLGDPFGIVQTSSQVLTSGGIILSAGLPLYYEYQSGGGNVPGAQPTSQEHAGIEFSPASTKVAMVTPVMPSDGGGQLRSLSANALTRAEISKDVWFSGLVRMDISNENHIFGYYPSTSAYFGGPIPFSITPTLFVGFQSVSGTIHILVKDGVQTVDYNTGLTFANGDDYQVMIQSNKVPRFFRNGTEVTGHGASQIDAGQTYLLPMLQVERNSGNFFIITRMSLKTN